MSLEDLLKQEIWSAFDFYLEHAGLNQQRNRLEKAPIEYIVDSKMEDYARFEIHNNGKDTKYILRFRPEAVADQAAVAEEAAHAARLILNDVVRNKLLKTVKGTQKYEQYVALEEYSARYSTLAYLNHLKITEFNKLWLEIADGNFKLRTDKPSDALSHFYGYTQAEIDYDKYGLKGMKKAFFADSTSVLREAYKLKQPQIIKIPA